MCEKGVKPFELNIDKKTGESFCDCVFFQFYNLLCQHFWQQEILYQSLLTSDMWAQYGFMWENCEFEIYKSIETEYIVNNLNKEIEAPKQHHLKVQKILKSLRTQYYSLKKNIEVQSVKLNVKNRVIQLWIQGLTEFMSTMSSKGVKNLIKKYNTLEGLKVDNSEVN